jgi:carbamoyltransferase
MYVLGIHYGHHDASVALIRDGEVVFAAAEERFTRVKHYSGLPLYALSSCLKESKISMDEIDTIAIPTASYYDSKLDIIFGRKLRGWLSFSRYSPEMKIKDYWRFFALYIVKQLHGLVEDALPVYEKRFPYPADKPISAVDHHTAHAASAYYTSGFDKKTLVVTSDGSGDLLSLTIWIGDKGRLSPLLKIGNNGSLGFFYSLVTEALGWWVGDGEGKTMGLAPYGDYRKAYGVLDKYCPRYEKGQLIRGVDFGTVGVWNVPSGTVHWHFRDSEEVKKLIDKYGRENIAAEAQRRLEIEMVKLVSDWLKREKAPYLVTAGGVFLNVKLNQRLWETGLIEKYHVYPDAGDGGLTVGAALYSYYQTAKPPKIFGINNVYWGPEYPKGEVEKILKIRKVKYNRLTSKELVKKVALLLSQNKIVGWFQGKMEAGPRALGNRSILMDPRRAENKDIINSRVKYREAFRPFCPSMTAEAGEKYLVNPMPNAHFMVVSFAVKPKMQKEIPAVVHVDGTVRAQIVTKETNPLFHDLLREFGKLTGVPVLLNTSFNIKGEPMIATPSDALKCFIDTGIDYLVIGNFLIEK